MHKHLIRLLLGGAMLCASFEFFKYGGWYLDMAVGAPPKTTNPLYPPGGDEDFFIRPNSWDYVNTEESKQFQAAAFLRLRAGLACLLVGSILVLLGSLPIVAPPVLRALSWLFLPEVFWRSAEVASTTEASPRPNSEATCTST